jgi:hypothetical protein
MISDITDLIGSWLNIEIMHWLIGLCAAKQFTPKKKNNNKTIIIINNELMARCRAKRNEWLLYALHTETTQGQLVTLY